ncbi:MAG: hypothetical protein HDR88_06025 [Bacteroides sp.]|nr:hypothetical protein [Bacteroides sp.]
MLALILAGLMLVSLVGCGGESNEVEPTPTLESKTEATATFEPIEATESPNAQEEVSDSPVVKETVSEQVLFDEGGIVITAKGFENDGDFDAELKLLIENNSDVDITVQDRKTSVNGYMMGTIFSCTVAAGKKANSRISFSSRDMETCGIRTIADIEFSFHIFGDEIEYIDSDKIQVKTSVFDTYEYSFDDSGTEIYNENGIRIVSKGLAQPDSGSDAGLSLFIENATEEDITAQVRDVSVNGFMVRTIFSEEVMAGKCALTMIKISNSSLEENEIGEIENMEFSFHIFDQNDQRIDTSPITVTTE